MKTIAQLRNEQLANHDALAADVFKDHVLVANADQLKRRQFGRPKSSLYWFDLVTWHGNLLVTGDIEACWWQREPDMLAWARTSIGDVDYFAGKVVRPIATREWNSEVATAWVHEEFGLRLERIGTILNVETTKTHGSRIARLHSDRDDLIQCAQENKHAFDEMLIESGWSSGEYPDLTLYKPGFLWARSAVQTALRLIPGETDSSRSPAAGRSSTAWPTSPIALNKSENG